MGSKLLHGFSWLEKSLCHFWRRRGILKTWFVTSNCQRTMLRRTATELSYVSDIVRKVTWRQVSYCLRSAQPKYNSLFVRVASSGPGIPSNANYLLLKIIIKILTHSCPQLSSFIIRVEYRHRIVFMQFELGSMRFRIRIARKIEK